MLPAVLDRSTTSGNGIERQVFGLSFLEEQEINFQATPGNCRPQDVFAQRLPLTSESRSFGSTGVLLQLEIDSPISGHFSPGNTSWSWFGGGGSDIGQMTTRGIATIGDHPGSRESAIMWIDPPKSSLYLFGGFGESPSSGVGYHNDLWVYANGAWKWISGDAAIDQVNTNNNVKNVFDVQYWPCSRAQTSGSYDPTTGYFYMFGGRGVTFGGTGALADLWAFSIGNNGVRKIRVTWGFL
jgi:hypothetical protein